MAASYFAIVVSQGSSSQAPTVAPIPSVPTPVARTFVDPTGPIPYEWIEGDTYRKFNAEYRKKMASNGTAN